jgi:hypothetical protein
MKHVLGLAPACRMKAVLGGCDAAYLAIERRVTLSGLR